LDKKSSGQEGWGRTAEKGQLEQDNCDKGKIGLDSRERTVRKDRQQREERKART
jgi:hypothetical protein